MNQKSSSSGFRLGSDDEGTDPYKEYVPPKPGRRGNEDPRVAKLSRRLTITSLLMPVLVALMVVLGYGLLEKRAAKIRNDDTHTVQALMAELSELEAASGRLEEQVAETARRQESLNQRMIERETPMNEAFLAFEKMSETLGKVEERLNGIDEKLGRAEVRLQRIDADKANADRVAALEKAFEDLKKTDLATRDARLAALEGDIEPVKSDLQRIQGVLSAIEEDRTRDRAELRETVESAKAELGGLSKDYRQLKKDLVDVLSGTIDQKELNRAVQNMEKNYRAEVKGLTRSLDAKDRTLSLLQSQIKNLESRVAALARSRTPLGTPKPGAFIEQNID